MENINLNKIWFIKRFNQFSYFFLYKSEISLISLTLLNSSTLSISESVYLPSSWIPLLKEMDQDEVLPENLNFFSSCSIL